MALVTAALAAPSQSLTPLKAAWGGNCAAPLPKSLQMQLATALPLYTNHANFVQSNRSNHMQGIRQGFALAETLVQL